jgi:short-subunit dehydrogenase
MPHALKPLAAQVLVITGATSGIGLATARAAAQRGASLILAARNEKALKALCEELRAKGARAEFVVADVANHSQVRAIAAKAETVFGGFDTWINNAGVSIYAPLADTPLEDHRRLFDTNYWGVVHGTLTAVERLKARRGGGVIINVGSILCDMAIPTQGAYVASKHAVKGFTDALRMELISAAPQITLTLIKPGAVDTPYSEHARSYTGAPVHNPPPVYSAPLVADTILYAAEHRVRELTIGTGGPLTALLCQFAPGLMDPLLSWIVPFLNKDRSGADADKKARDADALYKPGRGLRERVPYSRVREKSLYTSAQKNPEATAAVLITAGAFTLLTLALKDQGRVRRIRREAKREG